MRRFSGRSSRPLMEPSTPAAATKARYSASRRPASRRSSTTAPNSTCAPFYQTKATHAIALALDSQGRLLAGTESPGRVFQIDANGKPFVLLDSTYNEIHQLRVDAGGVIYAAAIRGRNPSANSSAPADTSTDSSAPIPVVSVSTEVTAIANLD